MSIHDLDAKRAYSSAECARHRIRARVANVLGPRTLRRINRRARQGWDATHFRHFIGSGVEPELLCEWLENRGFRATYEEGVLSVNWLYGGHDALSDVAQLSRTQNQAL